MKRCVILVLAFTVCFSVGCRPKGKKNSKSTARLEKGTAQLAELMKTRRQKLLNSAPTSSALNDQGHPFLTWMRKVTGTESMADYKKVAIVGSGTKVAAMAEALAAWVDAQKTFYGGGKLDAKEYWRELSVAARAVKGTPFEDDLEFDRLFFHVAPLAKRHDLFSEARGPRDDRVTHLFTNVRLTFDFEAKTSLYQEEINKLCKQKLGNFCDPIPMELRPFQVMKPYYERQIANIEAFTKKYPNSGYNKFLGLLTGWYKERIAQVPKWEEFPKLPGIRSTVAAPVDGNATLFITKKGISLLGIALRKADDAEKPWKPDWSKPDTELAGRISQLMEDTRQSTVSNFNQSDILLVPEPDVPMSFWLPLLQASIEGEHAKEWKTGIWVGRRRGDGSNQRAGFTLTILPADQRIPFKLKPPGGAKVKKCEAVAVVGRDALKAAGFTRVIYHAGAQVITATLSPKGALSSVKSAAPHGEGDRLEKWADQQNSTMVVAVHHDAPYEKVLEALNGVALRCEESECKKARTQPVFFASCR